MLKNKRKKIVNLVWILLLIGTLNCFGQNAKYNKTSCVIEFEASGLTNTDQIESVLLINSKGGASQKYTVNDNDATLKITSVGKSSGLTAGIFQIKTAKAVDTNGNTKCVTKSGGIDFEIPDNVEEFPVILNVLIKPKSSEEKRKIVSINVVSFQRTLKTLEIPRVEAEGKNDAEFYISGESITAVGKKPEFTADIKIEREFGKKGVPFLFTPFFKLKTSNDKKSDSDKLSFGVKFSNSFYFATADKSLPEDYQRNDLFDSISTEEKKTPKFTKLNKRRTQRQYFLWTGTAEIESDRHFRITNFITSQELSYLLRPKIFREDGNAKALINFTPFIGTDLGANLKSPVMRDERGIIRLKSGAILNLKINKPFGDLIFQSLNWENKFEQRWFAIKEQAYDKDDDGNLVLHDLGRKPRGYFSSDLQFKLSEFFGFGLLYEWGQLPPLYEKVNHRLKVGFTYSFKRDALQ